MASDRKQIAAPEPETNVAQEVNFDVTGMTCASCVRRIEKAEICGEPIDQSTLNDSLRCWLGLLRQFQVIKARRVGGQDLARAFAEVQDQS